jgi:hypothetical protein
VVYTSSDGSPESCREKLSIGNETPGKEDYVTKHVTTSKAELGKEQPSVTEE